MSSDKGDLDVGGDEEEHSPPVASADDQSDIPPISAETAEQEPGSSNQINLPYRLLVDSEVDVLLFVCALIDKRQKVVCYMPCGIPALKTYKQLMENVTEIPIHILNSSTSLIRDPACSNFLESHGSVLLVPETLSPQFEIEGGNSWVIHIGWPTSEAQYTSQRETHRAQNNILVAYAGDQSLYPSGDSIVGLTEPWPKDGASFRASVSILRPLYEVMLSEISLEMKSRVYQDWIQMHGIHGPRHVEAWAPSTVVQRANAYLLKVLRWSGEHTGGDNIPLPEVSREFVSQHGLESAVLEGILQVESLEPEPPAPSPSPVPRPDPVPVRIEFQPTIGSTYLTLHEEFDAIPLICLIAGSYDKVVCFLEGQGAFRPYHDLQRGITFGKEFGKHPSAAIPLDLTEDSVLAPMRKKTRSILASSKGIVKSLYATRVYGIAATPRRSLSAEEVARRANQYAARSLLHGDPGDGSEIFPPVAGRPSLAKAT
ncbi:hypothetical protein FRC11_000139, partial [Ceratobasidium sp. 423]